MIIGRLSDKPAHVRDSIAHISYRLRNRLTGVLCVPVSDNGGVRVRFGVNCRNLVFDAGCALADSLARVLSLPVANIGIGFVGCVLCGVDFGILCRLSGSVGLRFHIPRKRPSYICNSVFVLLNSGILCSVLGFDVLDIGLVGGIVTFKSLDAGVLCGLPFRVGRGIYFVVCKVSYLFHVCRESITATIQGSISVGAFKLFLLHFLRNGRIRESIIPVRRIAFKVGQAGSVLCDFCRIVRDVLCVFADVSVLNGLFSFQGINISLVGGDAIAQSGIGFFTGLCFGSVCRLISRVKVRNSLLAVGGLLRNSSGVCGLCGLCAGNLSVQTGGQVGNVGFNSIQAFAPCRHFLFPLNNLLVPSVDKFGELLVIFLELLNQSGQVKHGFLQVSELPVIVGRFDPVLCLSFRVRGQLCTLRHIALRSVAVAVVGHNGQRFILALIVPLHGVCENRDVPRTNVHTRAALERGRGTRVRMRRASVRVAAVTARRVGCTGNREIIAVAVCHNRMLLSQ